MGKMREDALERKVNQLSAVVSEQAERIEELKALVIGCFNVIEVPAAYFGGKWHYAPWYQDLRDKAKKLGVELK